MIKTKIRVLILLACFILFNGFSGTRENIPTTLLPKLSEYNVYKGNTRNLTHTEDYTPYEVASALFSDYALKQRLIKIPAGTQLKAVDNSLLDFPIGTIIVKTFYYQTSDADKTTNKLLETRLLVKTKNQWLAGTYKWNKNQNEAILSEKGSRVEALWQNEQGVNTEIKYTIPSAKDCKTCHFSNDALMPIGPKTRNLNIAIKAGKKQINQLKHWQQLGLLANLEPKNFTSTPNYENNKLSISKRAAAYLDINCAHCHNPLGTGAKKNYDFSYEKATNNALIIADKAKIEKEFEKQKMPKIGTNILHKEGLEILKSYLATLP